MPSLVKRLAVGFVMLTCARLADADTFVFPAAPPPEGGQLVCPQFFVISANDFQYDSHDIIVEGCMVLILEGQHTFASLTLQDGWGGGATVTHATSSLTGLQLTIIGDCTINSGSSIDVSRKGYAAGQGPGAGSTGSCAGGSGGGHGGRGGDNYYVNTGGQSYGELTAPVALGSGGGWACYGQYGGAGGGAVHLIVGGSLLLDGGIRADAGSAAPGTRSGGGAGGSIWVDCGSLSGAGTISANGGAGAIIDADNGDGGGGGGRVALYAGDKRGFTGTIEAKGGSGSNTANPLARKDGGAGTVYESVATWPRPRITIANGSTSSTNAAATEMSGLPTLDVDLLVANGAVVGAPSGSQLDLTITGDCVIDATSAIDVSRKGYAAGQGPGAGSSIYCAGGSGGGHGGRGGDNYYGNTGGQMYGDLTAPVTSGSGGGFKCGNGSPGAGGGAVHLIVGGSLFVDGGIRADGGTATAGSACGGGAGGSIWLECGSMSGSGAISANGGAAAVVPAPNFGTGGGGGGRIAIYSCDLQFDILSVVALGGASSGAASIPAQPGTIAFFSDRFGDANGDCTVDGADLAILLGSWGSCEGCPVDLNDDGVVDGADLAILLGAWKG